MKRFPEPGALQDANVGPDQNVNAPDVARARHELANRWLRLNQQQRLTDPELVLPAKMLDVMRAPLLSLDPKFRNKIGTEAAPGGKYVADQIIWALEHKVLPRRMVDGHFPSANEVAIGAKGSLSTEALDAIHEAARDALNARQRIAWNYFTSGKHPFLTHEQAAGLIAAMTLENNLDPDKWQGFVKNGSGYGIAQWNEHRREVFKTIMHQPLEGSSFEQQLKFVRYELEQGEYRNFGAQLRQQTDAYQAGYMTTMIYEAPRYRTREKTSIFRGNYARGVLREFAGH